MSLQNIFIWSSIGLFAIVPAVGLARWWVVAARRLVDRLVSDLQAKGEQPSERDRKAFVAQLMISGWKTRALTFRLQGVVIPDAYLEDWARIQRRIRRATLVWIVVGVAILMALKSFVLSQ